MTKLKGKTVIVTGGGGGIGGATCRRFAAEGAKVAVFDMNIEAAQKVADQITAEGGTAAAFQCNITDRAQVDAGVAAAEAQLGPIDVLVNNAGWDVFKPFVKTVPAEWDKLIAINLTGTFNVVRYASLAMSQNEPNVDGERGVIVNTSSGAAWQGQVGQAAYSASKAAVIGMTLPVARDLAQHGIRVVAVAPGLFETAMSAGMPTKVSQNIIDNVILFPHRMGQAQEFGGLVRHVVENAYLNATTISLDAGVRC